MLLPVLLGPFLVFWAVPLPKKQDQNRYFWPLPAKNTINNYSAAVSSGYQRVRSPLGPRKGCWRLSDTLFDDPKAFQDVFLGGND